MNEAEIRIAQTLLPRDWASLRDVVLQVISFFGRDLGLVMINRYLHEGLLELARVAPDGAMTVFSRTDCEYRTVHAPFIPAEGVRVEPYEAGQHFVRLAKLTSPATATPSADRQLPAADESELSQSPQAPWQPQQPPPATQLDEPAIADPAPASAPAADVGDRAEAVTAAVETAASPPKMRRGTTGRRPEKRNTAAKSLRADLRNQRLTPDELRNMKQEALAKRCGCGRETACKARDDVLSEIVGNCRK